MLDFIANIFQTAASRTNLIERYGGVVVPMTQTVKTSTGNARETFPVSCTVDGPCSTDGNWNKVVPDSALRGLAYVEQRGSAIVGQMQTWGYTLTYPVRMVIWLNIGKQNFDSCAGIITQVETNVINCLRHTKKVSPSWSSRDVPATVQNFVLLPKEPGQVFERYAYSDKEALYFWPYAFTAIDCEVVFEIPANCVAAIDAPTPVNCITY